MFLNAGHVLEVFTAIRWGPLTLISVRMTQELAHAVTDITVNKVPVYFTCAVQNIAHT